MLVRSLETREWKKLALLKAHRLFAYAFVKGGFFSELAPTLCDRRGGDLARGKLHAAAREGTGRFFGRI